MTQDDESGELIYAQNALTYLERGYSPIPLPAGKKWPPEDGYTGKTGKDATRDEVREWSVDRPDANIALRLPDTVIAIDVDAIDLKTGSPKSGVETLKLAIADLGPLPILGRSTASRITPGHGHYLFRVPAGTTFVQNLDKLYGPNVDIIQRGHRYLVAPPSTHPDTGAPYEWVPTKNHSDIVSFPPIDRLPALPQRWLEALRHVEREDDAEGISGGDRSEYETFSPAIREMVDFHVAAEVDRTLAKLERLKSLPVGSRDEDGRGWHDGIRDHTKYLARLCNAPWSPLLPSDLIPRLRENLPHDAHKTLGEGLNMFASAVEQPDGSDLPTEIGAALVMEALPKPDPIEAAAAEPLPESDEGPVVRNPYDGRIWPALEARFGGRFRGAADVIADMAEVLAETVRRAPGVWMVWDGKRWVHDYSGAVAGGEVTSLLGAQPVLYEPAPTRSDPSATRPTAYSKALGAEAVRSADKVLAKIMTHAVVKTDATYDADPRVINTPAGLLDLETGAVTEHDPSMKVTGLTRASYRANAGHPDLSRVLSIHPREVVDHLQLVLGAALTGHSDHRITLLHGPGGNGKTTLLQALVAAMGTYGFAGRGTDLADIMAGKGHKMVTAFEGKRLVLFEELAREGHLDGATIKRLAGGGKQGGDRKYEAHREWDPTASVVINSNPLPRISESDYAIYRRLRAIPLEARIPEEKQDPMIEHRLRTEQSALEAVFAWAVEGAKRFVAAGCVLPTPKSAGDEIAASTEAWFNDFDTTGQFIEAALVPIPEDEDTEQWIPLGEIYQRFERFWSEERGQHVKPYSPARFYSELRERGVAIYDPGQAQKAKRKLTKAMLLKLHPTAADVYMPGQVVTPVKGWAFRSAPVEAVTPDDVLAAIERREEIAN